MKFYEVEVDGQIVGCETTLKAAKALAISLRDNRLDWCITVLDVPVTVETVRRMIGRLGGYANTLRHVESP